MKAKFIHSSIFGSYYMPCTVIKKNKYKSKISYFDPYVNETCVVWMENEWIEFKK